MRRTYIAILVCMLATLPVVAAASDVSGADEDGWDGQFRTITYHDEDGDAFAQGDALWAERDGTSYGNWLDIPDGYELVGWGYSPDSTDPVDLSTLIDMPAGMFPVDLYPIISPIAGEGMTMEKWGYVGALVVIILVIALVIVYRTRLA